jgi:hypothetical protein
MSHRSLRIQTDRQTDYQMINIFRNNYQEKSESESDSLYTPIEFNSDQVPHRYSIYSNISEESKVNQNQRQKESEVKEEKVINDIISFYTNEPQISELIPLPISPENLSRLKNQWNKEFDSIKPSTQKVKSEKTVWKRISDSFKKEKKQKSPTRSLYDILTK